MPKSILLPCLIMTALFVPSTVAESPPFVFSEGCCFYEGAEIRTVVPPASSPQEGRDAFYAVTGGAAGQKPVVGVAPGDEGYHGGQWAFHLVTWTDGVTPYLLTAEDAVFDAAANGDVTITRDAANDFKCPLQR
ncbi:MAG: hypothetical protein ACT4PT_04235 [Methanobacteriota archaeon]